MTTPVGRVAGVTVSGAGFTTIWNGPVAVAAGRPDTGAESLTCAVNANVPTAVGVPEMVPEGLRVKPGGSEPSIIDQVYGGMPPVAFKVVAGYGTLSVAGGKFVGVTVSGAALIVIWNGPDACCWRASVAVAVNRKFPICVGVPVIVPAGLSVRPGGSAPDVIAQVYGVVPPVAFKVVEG